MIRNESGQDVDAQMINATTGAAFSGTVTCYVTIDAGTQTLGTVGSGVCTAKGNGLYQYLPTASETDGALVKYTFIGSGAVPVTVSIATLTTAQQATAAANTGPGAVTANGIINGALRLIGVLDPEETAESYMTTDGLRRLNMMMASWSLQPMTIPCRTREVFATVASQSTYTIGPGGDWDTTRPKAIDGMGLILTTSSPVVEIPIAMLTNDGYDAIRVKDLTSSQWTCAFYQPTFAGGLGSVILWPVPDNATYTAAVYRLEQLSQFVSLTAQYDLPEGAEEAIEYNLARRLASPYSVPVPPDVMDIARTSLATYKRSNTKLTDLAQDMAFTHSRRGGYSITTGQGG